MLVTVNYSVLILITGLIGRLQCASTSSGRSSRLLPRRMQRADAPIMKSFESSCNLNVARSIFPTQSRRVECVTNRRSHMPSPSICNPVWSMPAFQSLVGPMRPSSSISRASSVGRASERRSRVRSRVSASSGMQFACSVEGPNLL